VDAIGLGVREPGLELGEGGGEELGAGERAFGVLVGLGVLLVACWCDWDWTELLAEALRRYG